MNLSTLKSYLITFSVVSSPTLLMKHLFGQETFQSRVSNEKVAAVNFEAKTHNRIKTYDDVTFGTKVRLLSI